jgi:hypothetical protein
MDVRNEGDETSRRHYIALKKNSILDYTYWDFYEAIYEM